jgi:hypothetical protein
MQQWLLSPVSKLNPGEQALVPKRTLHLSPGGAGVQMMRDEYQSEAGKSRRAPVRSINGSSAKGIQKAGVFSSRSP